MCADVRSWFSNQFRVTKFFITMLYGQITLLSGHFSQTLSVFPAIILIYYVSWSASPHEKNYDFFTCVWNSQLAAGTSLALFSAMNEWQRILFLKREFSGLFRVNKIFM